MRSFASSIFLVLALHISISLSDVAYRRCGNDINNLWLDVVLVVDNSFIMQTDGVYSTIKSMFGPKVRIGTHKKDPVSTRVAIVTYNEEATVVANFDKFSSLEELNAALDKLNSTPKSDAYSAYMDLGLQAANDMIVHSNNRNVRRNYKKLIVLFTSNYAYQNARPDVLALSIRESGVDISTVYTGEGTTGNVPRQLSFVGNYNMNFHMSDSTPITGELQNATALANCFCPNAWYQYEWPRNSGNLFGVCVAQLNPNEYQKDAQKECRKADRNAYLTTEFNSDKRAFNYAFITENGAKSVSSYYNGLLNVNGTWFWDQPDGQPLLPLDPSSGSISAKSGCVADVKFSDGSVFWTPVSCGNRFPYICEMKTCDSENYCF